MGSWRKWYGHSIGHNSKSRRPSLFCFVDCETQQRVRTEPRSYAELELRCGVACFVEWRKCREPKEKWWEFDSSNDFWLRLYQLLKPRRVCWLIAHNMLFDATVLRLWNEMERLQLKTSGERDKLPNGVPVAKGIGSDWKGLIAIDGLPFHLELLHERGRLNVSDLMNYYPCSLETIGESVGMPKWSLPPPEASAESWLSYCKQDVQILKTAYLGLVKRWEEQDNGNWKMSAASLAWNNYRHTRDCSDIIVHTHSSARELEWKSYFGGECRAWYRGLCPGTVVHLDVNSLYPSVMAGNQYPVELQDYILCPHLPIVESIASRYAVVADVTMDNICDDIPTRLNGRIVYGVGAFRTQLAGPEFAACLRGGCVVDVHGLSYYKTEDIFTGYVARWYEDKRKSRACNDTAGESFAKLMLLSLQGKFAQRSKVWEESPDVECLRPWSSWPHRHAKTGTVVQARSIGWTAQVAENRRDCAHSFPAISSYITSYARQRMQVLRSVIPPSCLYYQDTDSLMVDEKWYSDEGRWILPMGDELGQLRVVNVYERLKIRGPKNYTADGKHCIAGIRKRDRQVSDTAFVCERMERTASVIGREPDGAVRVWERSIDVPGTCREGGYSADGWSIPLTLGLTKPFGPTTITV